MPPGKFRFSRSGVDTPGRLSFSKPLILFWLQSSVVITDRSHWYVEQAKGRAQWHVTRTLLWGWHSFTYVCPWVSLVKEFLVHLLVITSDCLSASCLFLWITSLGLISPWRFLIETIWVLKHIISSPRCPETLTSKARTKPCFMIPPFQEHLPHLASKRSHTSGSPTS